MAKNVLVIDDEESYREMLSDMLERRNYRVSTASSGEEGLSQLEGEQYDFILCDVKMPGMNGLEVLGKIKKRGYNTTLIMMSAYGSMDLAIKAMKEGAYDYISKPFKMDEVVLSLKKAEEREMLRQENVQLRAEVERKYDFQNIVSKNKVMQNIFTTIRKVGGYQSTILIYGESGTGKELVAKAIHYSSERSGKPFVTVNCGAIPENLLESELFGHVRGAFTGAIRSKIGLFEDAEGGTLFLDEIGELPTSLQVKILRALQEGEIRKVGDVRPIKVNVRIVAASVRDLAKEVEKGNFRDDLFYRLNVIPINIPPLRERMEDIPLLVDSFIKKFASSTKSNIKGISPQAMDILMSYHWPGNVRELENTVERSMVLSDAEVITPECLPSFIREYDGEVDEKRLEDLVSIKKASRNIEKTLIKKALLRTNGNRTQAAKLLEISHRALLYKIKEYGL